MNDSEIRIIDGTSALKPDCSRYSNENERIIDFERAAADWNAGIDYDRLERARHAKPSSEPIEGACNYSSSRPLFDAAFLSSIEGTSFDLHDGWKMKAFGCLYTALGLAAVLLSF